jgi:glycosyltransferase involved in cell wall biosynthesis
LLARKRFFYALATHLLTLSQAGQDDLVNTFGASPDKIAVFPNGMDDPLQNATLTATQKVSGRIVCVGRLSRSKGQDVLIRAVALLKDDPNLPDLHAVLVGDGAARGEYMALAESLGVADRIVFTGAVFHEVALGVLASGMVSVVPSRHEALGNVNLESLALGVSLIAADVDGIRDIVPSKDIGLLIPPDNAILLAKVIRTVMVDSELRDQLAKQGRAHYLAHYTLPAQTSRLADWLENLIQKDTYKTSSSL